MVHKKNKNEKRRTRGGRNGRKRGGGDVKGVEENLEGKTQSKEGE